MHAMVLGETSDAIFRKFGSSHNLGGKMVIQPFVCVCVVILPYIGEQHSFNGR